MEKGDGATTVATTMMFAAAAGIRLFVTGGIGGVHRDEKGTDPHWDVSADLEELVHSNVAVICAGAKSILDLPRTLEFLETKGVPVVGYRTTRLPAFFTRDSGLPLQSSCDNPRQMAELAAIQTGVLKRGMVICNPIPAEAECHGVDEVIEVALAEAERLNVRGKDITPFLLKYVNEATGGRSLEANIALVENNARLGAAVALALTQRT